jgi:hypothetical protein
MKFATIQPCTHKVVKQTIAGGNCVVSERLVVKCGSKEIAEKLCKIYQVNAYNLGDEREVFVVEVL